MFFRPLLSLPRTVKNIIMIFSDIVLITLSYWGAFWVRLDRQTPISSSSHWILLAIILPITILIFIKLGLYRIVLRYVNSKIITGVLVSVIFSSITFVLLAYFFSTFLPRTVPVIYFSFTLLFVCGSRFIFRLFLNHSVKTKSPVVIYGAGESGRQLISALTQANRFFPVAFIDDAPHLNNSVIHGITVYSPDKLEHLIERYNVKKILLAMPRLSVEQRRKIISHLECLSCEVLSIPKMSDLVEGRAKIDSLKKISIEELLGRDPVSPEHSLLKANIKDKVVMVTGAGGSIGSELCRQIIRTKPRKLVLFESSEYSLYAINKEIISICKNEKINSEIIPLLGSVQKKDRLQQTMQNFKVNTVYHAAAYKHVPLVEHNVIEGVKNNVFGTLYCAQAAIDSNVSKFVLISTDKAVRPTNTMGATKRLAELILQALSQRQDKTNFSMVRFGNVLGSSGSVVPLFQEQINNGGPITLTHKDIIRYFMTIPEAAQLVIQAGAMGKGGDVFVLDMGKPVKIFDLAQRMIRLNGLTVKDEKNPKGNINIEITGLRPGEKLYEELLIGNDVKETIHPRIMTANEIMLEWPTLSSLLIELDSACNDCDYMKIRSLLLKAPTAFQPTDEICDLIWKTQQ
ncbi:polysaccharide biosynthesis protein [Xenorhabdus bovienii]|uniref:polysaccharide biosynthesis protein n=1 Tax=Xenorhabdus bovienii TaxID=40576 RepID=UPI0023B26C95|nr:nucleoside-diphosphate sugar epimerase/dehydratase [Xenorhabdus bovienii]MDE9493202.1 polysaccharide biosynthesis protein [Xenorhabdus bovienii]MDE9501738.1 polysaccharide biosynthesis protein [Xenorhabdus bovienii]MDE9525522.1 polysaccharide biosynthesis protein [Xenorhabdus bovienii]MDE9568041.1 polysaccharide biosynthesis protein [Xenorhabdus bovienii]